MICIDTTVLIDEFRAKGDLQAPVNRFLIAHGSETLILPVIAAGEFLDGAAMVSQSKFQEALTVLRCRFLAGGDLETAQHYARIVSHLRVQKSLAGKSQNDLWIAATARRHGARLLTRNVVDFANIPDLAVLGY